MRRPRRPQRSHMRPERSATLARVASTALASFTPWFAAERRRHLANMREGLGARTESCLSGGVGCWGSSPITRSNVVRGSKARRSMHCTALHPARYNLSWTGVVLNALVVWTASVLAHVHRALRLYARPSAHCGKQEPKPQVFAPGDGLPTPDEGAGGEKAGG